VIGAARPFAARIQGQPAQAMISTMLLCDLRTRLI
jgi:hypothetical protein